MTFGMLCSGILGHNARYMVPLAYLDAGTDASVMFGAIAQALDKQHRGCLCGRSVSPSTIWRTDIAWKSDIEFIWEDIDLREFPKINAKDTVGVVFSPPPRAGELRLHVVFGLDPMHPGMNLVYRTRARRLIL